MNEPGPLLMLGAALSLIATTASAQDSGAPAEEGATSEYQVAERDEDGQVTKVVWNGQVYDVCVEDGQDSCINPRDAGLDFGARELDYWPGKPASQIDEPLPATPPPAQSEGDNGEGVGAFDGAFTDLNEPAAR